MKGSRLLRAQREGGARPPERIPRPPQAGVKQLLKAVDITLRAGQGIALVVVDLPLGMTVSAAQLARLRQGAERAGAVVLSDVEAGATVVGAPARAIEHRGR